MINSLSGRFLLLTILFVMLAEVLIFVPSVARFREDYLLSRLERAQIASLASLGHDMIDPEVERELLDNAGVYNVVLRRNEISELVLSSPIPAPISETVDLRQSTPFVLMRDALKCLLNPKKEIIRVVGYPTRAAGVLIEVTMPTEPLRQAMFSFGLRILVLSAVISIMTAALLFFCVRYLLVIPIKGVVEHMKVYAEEPEDARRIIEPQASVRELREAEDTLQSMQKELTSALRQKQHLAQLGAAVAKVSHDLRNMLTTAQLFADRMEHSNDPRVARAAPKLVNSISRAVNLCEATLAFGRAEEPPPQLSRVQMRALVDDVLENERLALCPQKVDYINRVSNAMMVRCDSDQMMRVLGNLVRNARQAIGAMGRQGAVTVSSEEDDKFWIIDVTDTGPGLPKKARDHLFTPFQGGATKGGTGLGLAISAELVKGHGGRLELLRSDEEGTVFRVSLPKGSAMSVQNS
ncbi:sensor histidine kinase [Qingshengfaniella alkalisoli]|uniref:histidine kinase n=1 Tax=Qingshengfaniella alkalisoli TaxID=2599296 RepID=A0A5B8IW27_9RHOB|nr:HAMP domain-containing sensor histidine kinase [Qingshengfaniella alkalisoli]QDY69844.1 HAMP domain-containing histidine kinase [Qingshengfaniella alkalisoli]